MTDQAIRLSRVGKRYTKYDEKPLLLTRALHPRTRRSALWAIRGVDLIVSAGQSVGVVGRNGSGKSTLLQLLGGITAPTEGKVEVRGRVAPLVAVGVGFHPELTGRENVYVNGIILGLSRRQIDKRFDAIVEFSGIEPFIDTPVKFYSSGMYVRLGFAVAVESTPDILLVDEVLAVGDIGFQVKCFQRMADIRQSGTTIIVVSHNLDAIRQVCDRSLVLHDGRMVFDGSVDEAVALYHDLLGEYTDPAKPRTPEEWIQTGVASVESVRLLGPDGKRSSRLTSGDPVTIEVVARFHTDVACPAFGFAILTQHGVNVYSDSTLPHKLPAVAAGDCRSCRVRMALPLGTGSYSVRAGVRRVDDDHGASTLLDSARPVNFYVNGRPRVGTGVVDLHADFEVDGLRLGDTKDLLSGFGPRT